MFVFVDWFRRSRETAEHDVSHGEVDVGTATVDRGFMFAAEQAVATQPAERAFHDPAVRKDFEALDVIAAFHDLQIPAECLPRCFDQFARVATIGPDLFESCFTTRSLEYQSGSVTVLNTGGRDHNRDHQPQRVNQNVPFATFHFLPGVVRSPRVSVVFADWLSTMAAEAVGSRPSCFLT